MAGINVITLALTLISFTLCLSLMVGWATLGRPRHALLWAGAFGFGTAQWALTAGGAAFGIAPATGMVLSCSLGVGVTLMLLAGFRTRAGRGLSAGTLLATGGAAVMIIAAATASGQDDLAKAVPQLSRALLLPFAVATMFDRLRRRYFTEVFASGVLTVFALQSLVIGSLRVIGTSESGELAHLLVSVGLPVAFANVGAAALLLLASDLSERLEQLAVTDPLTGLLNRRGFENAVAVFDKERCEAAVLMLDVDGFKEINDEHGHAVGDAVLARIAECLQKIVRPGDAAGRIGGDEFAVLLASSDLANAELAAHRIRAELARGRLAEPDLALPSVSVGTAPLRTGPLALSLSLGEADRDLYRAKAERRPGCRQAPRLMLVQ